MRKFYSLIAMLFMVFTMYAASPYSVNITSDPENIWYSGDEGFSPAEIAAELGLADAEAVKALINEGGHVYLKTADGMTNTFWASLTSSG